jgi:thiamine biosynthesis lipoprotein
MASRQYGFSFKAMACRNELSIYSKNKKVARSIADAAIAVVNRLERRYSRYLPNSMLTKINESAGDPSGIAVDDETVALLDYAQACYEQSEGLFDVTSGVLRQIWNFNEAKLPSQEQIEKTLSLIGWDKVAWDKPRIALPIQGMELDFGGVVKEYAADTCANLCRSRGVNHGMINMGGDIHIIGPHPDGSPWKIGIQKPNKPGEIATTVDLTHGGLASSGDYQRFIDIDGRRYSHILNPKTGWPVRGLRAVTVIAPQCLIAGSTSTIAMLKGSVGKQWLKETGLPYIWFDEDGRQFLPSGHAPIDSLTPGIRSPTVTI